MSAARGPHFEVRSHPGTGPARAGRLHTRHGPLDTPAFLPVATYGAVRGIAPEQLRAIGVQGLLSNTYHLHLRPGEALVEELGGLHRFMGWSGPILTDSGGFQIHSLDHLCRRSEDGVRFRSPIDGAEIFLTPEGSVQIQERLGADLIVVLDEFEPVPAGSGTEDVARTRALMERTLRWAERGRGAQRRADQLLFGIVQGGGDEALRRESAERTRQLGFAAHAIGGLGLGESAEQRRRLVVASLEPLPVAAPRYLMGLGTPPDLVDAVRIGIDLFDCVVPTRHGRHGSVFTSRGRLNLRNARFRHDPAPLDAVCGCPVCRHHSRGYLRHLLTSNEMLGGQLASLHNLAYYMNLMRSLREAILDGSFEAFHEKWWRAYAGPDSEASASEPASPSPAATHRDA